MPLPAGYKLDKPAPAAPAPKLPPGYALDSAPAEVAIAASSTPPPPDLTTNSIDPATGTGYGLYRMGSYDYNQGQVTKPEIQVPYNRVADAQAAGYNLHPDEVPRYQNDTKHNGSVSRATGQVKSLLSRMTEPMPDRPLNGTPFHNAAAALTNVGQLPFNVVNRTARGVVGLPQGMAQGAMDFTHGNPEGFDPFAMAENSYKGLQQDTADLGPMAALGNLGGDAATMYAAGKLGSHAVEAGTEPMMKVVRGVRNAPEFAARVATGTGKAPVEELVKQRQIANEGIDKANVKAQGQYNRKIGETARQNREAAVAERAKADQAAHLQVGGSQLIYGLQQLDKALRVKAGTMFDAVRELVAKSKQPPLPGTDLGAAARAALTKVTGSSELPKPFRDILGKYPEAEPDTIAYQGAQIPKGHPLYDVLAKNGATATPPVTFGDLQGYYSETGAELSRGDLPGDIYTATKELHNSIGDMMQKMAKTAGPEANKMFWDSRKFYSGYMDTFHEPTGPSSSGSPVAQALLAKDPLVAVDKFSGKSGDRGVADLRRYSDSLANLAQDVRQRAQTDIKVPAQKAVADIGRFVPEPHQTISAGDITAAKKAAAEASAGKWWNRGRWAAAAPVIWAMRGFFGGHIPSIPMTGLEAGGIMAATKAATELLRYPPMIDFLTKARPEDVALIPPELRGDLPGLVSLAQRQGIKVAPALVAATAGAGGQATNQPVQQGVQQ